jgi:hypothetical protein
MTENSVPTPEDVTPAAPTTHTTFRRRLCQVGVLLLLAWLVVAYLLMPRYWKHYVRQHPGLADIPGITHTGTGMPGDPLNVALIGTEEQVLTIMAAARWYAADPLTLKSSLKIAEASVLKRPYDAAPVSSLFLFDRKQDLAFEKPVGNDPRKRHHVRFWRSEKVDSDGRPVWVGAAIYDERVELSRTTGQITHRTSGDIDDERDFLFKGLENSGQLAEMYTIDDFHKVRSGRNGGGDPWHTDGKLDVGVIKVE